MAGSQISTSVSIIDSLSGFMALSLTEYNTSAAAAIAAGSKVEIAGAFFQFPADETPTGWSSITTGTTAYIALTASGTAGSQVVDASYTSTAPTWRDDLQGWYASAASSVRIVASVYKSEATQYINKRVFDSNQLNATTDKYNIHGCQVFTSSGTFTAPLHVSTIYISGCANGGDGATGGATGGGGGGGGEWAIKKPFSVIPGQSYSVTIGSISTNTSIGTFTLNRGSSGSGGSGGAGGSLSMGSGAGGSGGNGGSSMQPGRCGFSSGGSHGRYNSSAGPGGGGGGSWGGGGNAGTTEVGLAGGYGGGGGGGGATGGSYSGGSGGSAILIVEW